MGCELAMSEQVKKTNKEKYTVQVPYFNDKFLKVERIKNGRPDDFRGPEYYNIIIDHVEKEDYGLERRYVANMFGVNPENVCVRLNNNVYIERPYQSEVVRKGEEIYLKTHT